MKKSFLYLFVAFAMSIAMISCDNSDNITPPVIDKPDKPDDPNDKPDIKKFDIEVSLKMPSDIETSKLSKISLKVVNTTTEAEQVKEISFDSKQKFSLLAGTYKFVATAETTEKPIYSLSGSISKDVSESGNLEVELFATSGSGLIFSEIFYAGSPNSDYGYFYDQYYEVYNNSNETKYLDNTVLFLVSGFSTQPSPWLEAGINDRYPTSNYVMYLAGDGKKYPVKPYTSVVIAQSARNHIKENPATEGKAGSTVDLTNAEYELYVGDVNDKDTKSETATSYECVYYTNKYMADFLLSIAGQAVAIAKVPTDINFKEYINEESNLIMHPAQSFQGKSIMMPFEWILDAVDIVDNDAKSQNKRLLPADDASVIFVTDGSYSGKSIRRKVKSVVDGKVLYKDTNNSAEDFVVENPTPNVHPTTIDK